MSASAAACLCATSDPESTRSCIGIVAADAHGAHVVGHDHFIRECLELSHCAESCLIVHLIGVLGGPVPGGRRRGAFHFWRALLPSQPACIRCLRDLYCPHSSISYMPPKSKEVTKFKHFPDHHEVWHNAIATDDSIVQTTTPYWVNLSGRLGTRSRHVSPMKVY